MIERRSAALRMYGGAPKAAAKPAKAAAKGQAPTAASKTLQGGSIDLAISSALDRVEAKYRDDPEKREFVRSWRAPLAKVLSERHVDPGDAHTMLATFLEHEAYKRSPEALQKRWSGPSGYEALRLEAGDTAEAKQILDSAERFYTAIKTACPGFAHNAKVNGSAEHPDVIRIAAKYGDAPVFTNP